MMAAEQSAGIYKGAIAKGYVSGLRYVHRPVRFAYRVPWRELRAKYSVDIRKAQAMEPPRADEVAAKLIEMLVTEWDVTYRDDHPEEAKRSKLIPLDAKEILKEVYDPVISQMGLIIGGFTESDLDPADSAEEQLATMERQDLEPEDFMTMLSEADSEREGNS